jgi:hypothetical protein
MTFHLNIYFNTTLYVFYEHTAEFVYCKKILSLYYFGPVRFLNLKKSFSLSLFFHIKKSRGIEWDWRQKMLWIYTQLTSDLLWIISEHLKLAPVGGKNCSSDRNLSTNPFEAISNFNRFFGIFESREKKIYILKSEDDNFHFTSGRFKFF